MNRLSGIEATVGTELLAKIRDSYILVVGAGGIGCELLKDLALSGFRRVDVIDLDTIDVSNLNRQLLFRSHHVGQPKCRVACAVAARMAADPAAVAYVPHHGNVCDGAFFDTQFVQRFDLVLNALDNVAARRRVNRICLAAGTPLVEAGTTGYLGQVNVIDKDSEVACYECKTQEAQKVYPICTIRSTPSMPVHTIVWAKEFYKLLFGDKVEESMLFEDPSGSEPSTFMEAVLEFRRLFATSGTTTGRREATKTLVHKFYIDEITKQLGMDRYKTAQKVPVPLEAALIDAAADQPRPSRAAGYRQTDVPSRADCVAEFVACLEEAQPGQVLPSFDKDDMLSMRFVTATSNLRNYVFGIEPIQSFYSAKGIAGNIIPAIATTNAIAAGLQILQAFHILRRQLESGSKTGGLAARCRYINIVRERTRNGQLLTAASLEPPNPRCYVCRKATVALALDARHWTLQQFLERIVKRDLGFAAPTLLIDGAHCVWEEGDGADVEAYGGNAAKLLTELPAGGIRDGVTILIDDFSQELEVEVVVTQQEVWAAKEDGEELSEEEMQHQYRLGGGKPAPVASSSVVPNGDTQPMVEEEEDDDDDAIIEVTETAGGGDEPDRKRPAVVDAETTAPPAKRPKSAGSDGGTGEIIALDDE